MAGQPDVIISEVQTASSNSAGEEFIEFFNTTNSDIDFADTIHGGRDTWKLQYFTGTKITNNGVTDWTKPSGTIDLAAMKQTVIPAHDYYVLAALKSDAGTYAPGGITADGGYSAKFADTAAIQLVDYAVGTAVTTVHDRLTWQKNPSIDGVQPAPPAGSSLQRLPNDNQEYVNPDGSMTTFAVKAQISPRDAWVPPIVETDPVDENGNSGPPGVSTTQSDGNTSTSTNAPSLLMPNITELLPNPASPQTDAEDEFIELYNPNDSAFNLKGYSLETGTTTLHDFTFISDTILGPHSYTAFYSAITKLSLSNTSGQARLLNPAGTVIDQSDQYSQAADGQAWALIDSGWQWTTYPTPNTINILSSTPKTAEVTSKKSAVTKSATVKTMKVKGLSTTKTKTKKTASTKPKKQKKTKTAVQKTSSHLSSVVKPAPIHRGILAAIAVAAVLYALYEYRIDLANYFYRRRADRTARRTNRSTPARR